jgi:signal transduction histidine kinase
MRLASRMTVIIGACALVLIGGGGWVQLRSEERDLRAVAEGEVRLLGRSLQTAFKSALRDRRLEDVTDTLKALAPVDPEVAVFVFDEEGKLVAASRGARPSNDVRHLEVSARSRSEPVLQYVPPEAPRALLLGRRLREEEPDNASAIVLEKPLAELQRDLRETRGSIWLTTSLLVLTVAGLTWGMTHRYVALPLGRMVANMKRVRSGDLRIAHVPKARDEVGEALEEFEQLVADLDAARVRADSEFEARRRIERGLQNADKLITLGQLSAVMAHEIGSPLQILEGRARALNKHADDAAATRRTADMLVEQTERITRIVGQMLSITRRRPSLYSAVDAEASIRRVVALLEIEARRRQVDFHVCRTGPVDVVADDDQLQQVALNVLRNALEASPPHTTVSVQVGGDGERLIFEVRDEGAGVPASAREHLFEPFFTTKADLGGSGLGLSVVKSIVVAHGGKVSFVDEAQAGCCVRVDLPRRPGRNAA